MHGCLIYSSLVFWQGSEVSRSKEETYSTNVIASSPKIDPDVALPPIPHLQIAPRPLSLRAASMFKVLVCFLHTNMQLSVQVCDTNLKK